MLADCWAVVPLKRIDQGKERLAETLDADARRALIAAMAGDVLAALLAVPFEPRAYPAGVGRSAGCAVGATPWRRHLRAARGQP